MTRHAQITKNNKFAISQQHGKKEVSDTVDFLHADKDENFPKVPKKASLQCLYNIPKKLEMKFTFLMQININVS